MIARAQDYQRLFSSDFGKRVLYDMMSVHYVMKPLPTDPNERDRAEGERNVLLRIFSILKVDSAKVQKLIQEADDYVAKESSI